MSRIIVIGAGPVGRATARHLLATGAEVLVATRSGTAPEGTTPLRADVTADGLAERLPAHDALIAACNFPYGAWARHWPAAGAQLIGAAERHGSTLVIAGNLYAYGPPSGAMRETDPLAATYPNGRLRAQLWERALDAHRAGRIRATELRASDYIGPNTGPNAHGGDRLLGPVLEGRAAWVVGDPDQPHSWTALDDFGRLLARAATDASMLGRPWHVPSAPACSMRELADHAAAVGGAPAPRLRRIPRALLRAGRVEAAMRAIDDASYQFRAPFVVDDSDARTLLGETAAPWRESIAAAVAALRGEGPGRRTHAEVPAA